MFEFFSKIIEEFGGLGLGILVLGGLLYFLITQSDKKTERSLTDLSENLSNAITEQNKTLVNTLSNTSSEIQKNLMALLEKSMSVHDNEKISLHNASMKHRLDISDKMQSMLYDMMNFYHARRCGVMEFHNSTDNLNGLSFLWYDLSYENLQRNIMPISGQCKKQQLSMFSPVMNDIINNDGIIVFRPSDIDKLERRSPVLYDNLRNKIKVSTIIYAGLYNISNNLIGIVFLEYDDNVYKYPESLIDLTDIKERASGISQLLDFKSSLQN